MSATEPAPGTLRPRGRTERVRQAVITATRNELAAGGYTALTVERVAEAAGVAKSTVYRRWRDTTGLLLELMRDLAATKIPLADTGSVEQDLRALARGILGFFVDHVAGAMVLAVIAESVHDRQAAEGLREFWRARNEQAAEAVRRGVERGEIPADTDCVEVIRALGAPFYYRMLVTHEPIDEAVAERAAAAAVAAARGGVFTGRAP